MITGSNTSTDHSPLDGLSAILTSQQIAQLVKKAVPELKQAKALLQESLEQQQWDAAAIQAHRLKSSVGLFSVTTLVEDLDRVEAVNTDVITQPGFSVSLVERCEQLIHHLEKHLLA